MGKGQVSMVFEKVIHPVRYFKYSKLFGKINFRFVVYKLESEKPNSTAVHLNWLIYTLYARNDHELCKTIISQQMQLPGDKEYLFFIKVKHKYIYMRCILL